MGKTKNPVTAAVRALRRHGIAFDSHPYDYVDGGGTARFSAESGVEERLVVKTLVMQDEAGKPLVVLMTGDRQVSTKALARQIGARGVEPCDPKTAERHSGYQVGGTSPFGLRHPLPVYCEAAIAQLPRIYVNGGKRGYIVSMDPKDLLKALQPVLVEVGRD